VKTPEQRAGVHRLGPWGRLAWLPIPLLLVAIAALWVADLRTAYESTSLLLLSNLTFNGLVSLFIGYLAGRSFLVSAEPGLVMLGSGALLWGMATMAAAAFASSGANVTVTVHNIAILGAALSFFGGLRLHGRVRRPGRWLAAAYATVTAAVVLLVWAAQAGWTPVFFVQGQGGTPVRQVVLLATIAVLALTAWRMVSIGRRQAHAFFSWYGLGLALLATGLTGVMLQSVLGSVLGWTGRIAQYLGGAYLFNAAASAVREAGAGKLPIAAMSDVGRDGPSPERLRQQSLVNDPLRYLLAALITMAAMALRLALEALIGPGLPPFVTFYPAVMTASLLAGFGPGLLATALSGLVAGNSLVPPTGASHLSSPVDRVALVLFLSMGVFIAAVAELYRRNRQKAAAYDREEALRAMSEEKEFLATLLENAAQPFAVCHPDGRLRQCNRAFERLTGYTADELREVDWSHALTPEEWREVERRKLDELERSGQPVLYEKEYIRKDGSRVPVEVQVNLARGPEGVPEYFYAFIADVSERKRATEERRDLELRSSALIDAATESIWMFGLDGTIRAANATAAARLGRRVDEVLGTRWADYLSPEVAAPRAQKIDEVLRTKGAVSFEDERAGIVFDHSFYPVFDQTGMITAVAVFSRDITARRLVEKKLQRSEALYRSIGESIDYGVWVCDPDGRNTYASESFLRMVGMTQEQCSNFGWGDVLHPDDAERTIAAWQECVRTGGTWDIEHRFRGVDGHWHHVLARGVPVRNERGEVLCWAGINLDIRRLKAAEEALRESEERFRSVLENSLDVIYRLNVQTGRYEYISPSVLAVTGYAPEEVEAMDVQTALALIHPDDLPAMRTLLARLEEAGDIDMEYRQRTRSGDYRWMSNRTSLSRDGAGRPLFRSGNVRDVTLRKQVEEERAQLLLKVQNQAAELDATIASMAIGLIVYDRSGRAVRMNDVAQRLLQSGLFFGKSVVERRQAMRWQQENGQPMPLEELPVVAALRGETRYNVVLGTALPDRTLWLSASAAPIRAHDGSMLGAVASFIDISDRKQTEEVLRESEQRFRDIASASSDWIWELDHHGVYTFASGNVKDVLGYEPAELLGRTPFDLMPPDEAARAQREFEAVLDRRIPFRDFENDNLHKDGTLRHLITSGVPILNAQGSLLGYRGVDKDVTVRRQAEQELHRRNAILEGISGILAAALSSATEADLGLACLEVAQRLTRSGFGFVGNVNKTGLEEIAVSRPGAEAGAVRGAPGSPRPTSGFKLHGIYGRVVTEGRALFTNDPAHHADPATLPAGHPAQGAFLGAPLLLDGRTVGVIGLAKREGGYRQEDLDVLVSLVPAIVEAFMRKRAEDRLHRTVEELARSNKELEHFAYISSHDLQEPLRMVTAFTGLLRDRYGGRLDAKADEYIAHALEGATRMQTLINDLLAYSRLGGKTEDLSMTDAAEALATALADLETSRAASGASVTADPLPTLVADGSQLAQLFQNLIGNSIKYRREGVVPEIHVGAERRKQEWLFFVRDNGIGIESSYFEQIFEIFQRLHGRREYPGTGVGLAICRKIVERHGGRIWVASEPGRGSTFSFTIPDASPAA
jgi:PAS domain S-box-containing protein